MKEKLILLLPFIIVVFFTIISTLSLLKPGLPPTHDGEYHIIRFYEFDKVLKEGNWYPRWAPDLNNGFGIPLFNYVYPLPNYIASLLHMLNFSFIDSFKLQMFIASIIGAIFFYVFSKQFWGVIGGVASSIVYTFSPYHFVDIYVRGSVGEVWALAIFPAFLWSVTKLIKEKKDIFLPVSSLFLALVIFSHNILGLMFFIFAICFCLFLILQNQQKKDITIKFILMVIFGLSLSSIFWLPALIEGEYVRGLKIYNVKDNFSEVYQLIFPSWGTGFSSSDLQSQMSFQIGITNLFAVMLSFVTLIMIIKDSIVNNSINKIKDQRLKIKNNIKDYKYIIIFFLSWFVFVFFLMLKISLPIWETIPFMNYFQFPWRLLSLEILVSSFLVGSIFLKQPKILAIIIILLAFILTYNYTKPAYYHQRDDIYYISKSNFIDGTNSVGNYFNTVWFNNNLKKTTSKLVLDKGVNSLLKQNESQKLKLILSSDNSKSIILNVAYFPGWTMFLNGNQEKISLTTDGRILFNIPKGESKVEITFLNTFIREIATLISVITFVILVLNFTVCLKIKHEL